MEERRKIFVGAFWVGFGTFFSRVFGLVREIGMAALFGTGVAADAFAVALRFPNLLRTIVGEGAFSAAFLPKFTEVMHRRGEKEGYSVASAVFTVVLFGVAVLCLLGIIFAPQVIDFIVIGWENDVARKELAVKLVRILFLMVGFIGLASFAQAMLNFRRRFFVSSLAPAVWNLTWAIGIFVAAGLFTVQSTQAKVVAAFVVLGAFFQFLWQLPWVRKGGWRYSFSIREHKRELLEMGKLLLPSLLALAASEFYYLADVILASYLPGGSVSSIYYARRIIYLPLGLIGFSIATASLPRLSETAAREDYRELGETLSTAVRTSYSLLLPITVMTIFLRTEIISLLFERGSFTAAESTPMVAWALLFYMGGMPFMALQKTLTQGFYALKDTLTPVLIVAVGIVINIELSAIFMLNLAQGGLALGSALASFLNAAILFYYLSKKLPEFGPGAIWLNFLKITTAGLLAGFVTGEFNGLVGPHLDVGVTFLTKLVRFAVPAVFYAGIFALLAELLRIREVKYAWSQLFRRLGKKLR